MDVTFPFFECRGNHKDKEGYKLDPITGERLVRQRKQITKIGNICYNDSTIKKKFIERDRLTPFKFERTHPNAYAYIANILELYKDPAPPHKNLTQAQILAINKKMSGFIEQEIRDGRSGEITELDETYYMNVIDEWNEEHASQPDKIIDSGDFLYNVIHPTLGGSRKSKKRKGKPYKKSRKSKRKR